jgi:hypothetical protein
VIRLLAVLFALSGALLSSSTVWAIPEFARQTNVACGACHAPPPSLTTFGRRFKQNGYTFSTANPKESQPSAFVLSTQTWIRDGSPRPVPVSAGSGSSSRIEAVSVSLGGAITETLGGFATINYDGVTNRAAFGNLELRKTRNTYVNSHNVLFGLTLNNNPGFQDPWNSSALRFWPYIRSGFEPQVPMLAVDGVLAGRVLGLSGSAFIDDSLLLEVGAYRGLGDGLQRSLGVDRTGAAELNNTALYARVMREVPVRFGSFSIGASLLNAKVTTPGRPVSDDIRDIGVDAMFQRNRGPHDYTLLASYVNETIATGASVNADLATRREQHLDRFQASANYLYRKEWGVGLGYTQMSGSRDPLYFGTPAGKPDYGAVRFDALWNVLARRPLRLNPLLSTRLGLQILHFNKYAGATRDVDGAGRRATDNSTVTAYWVIVF